MTLIRVRLSKHDTALYGSYRAMTDTFREGCITISYIGIGLKKQKLPVEFIADRPFIFTIEENETGVILFAGVKSTAD